MKGAVAAGHPLTAQAGARVLAEGGNAVDACVAAAFAAAVTESFLTGPGAGGFMLVHRARERDGASRRLLRRLARARPSPSTGRRDAGDRRRLRDEWSGDAAVPDRPRVRRRPGRRPRARGRPRPVRPPAVARAAAAGDRACAGRRRADTVGGAPACDPRPDHPGERRGRHGLQHLDGLAPRCRGRPAAAGSRRDARGDLAPWSGGARRAAPVRGRWSQRCATAAASSRSTTWRGTGSSGARRCVSASAGTTCSRTRRRRRAAS